MPSAAPDLPVISWDEFLALDWPHEWARGVAYAMGATTPRHAQLCARLAAQLTARGECSAYAAGLVVYVAELDRAFLPDFTIVCGAAVEAPGKPGAVTNPTIVFEVLSPSAQSHDRTTKLDAYQRLTSLEAYVIVHQEGLRVEAYRRTPAGAWTARWNCRGACGSISTSWRAEASLEPRSPGRRPLSRSADYGLEQWGRTKAQGAWTREQTAR